MYIPGHFKESRVEVLHGMIRGAGLATLVTMTEEGMIASHIPFLLDPEPAPYGRLTGHISRANPQARLTDPSVQALVIFQGPDGYISPSWYPTKRETEKVVPTWNYVAIHAYGTLELFTDRDRLLDVITRLTNRQEADMATPWAVTDAPPDFLETMLKGFVGVSLPIARLEGKAKLSQNRPAVDQAGVVEGLRARGQDALADAVARVAKPAPA